MHLFDSVTSTQQRLSNILPRDGVAHYYGKIIDDESVNFYLQHLLTKVQWRHDKVILFGKEYITSRKTAWYGDKPFRYTYSKITKTALTWFDTLIALKGLVEDTVNENFNACLLNLYHSGTDSIGWHADNEPEIEKNSAIASISLGSARRFVFKHKLQHDKVSIILKPGSFLLIKGSTQSHWLHALPSTKRVNEPRINLTFRHMIDNLP